MEAAPPVVGWEIAERRSDPEKDLCSVRRKQLLTGWTLMNAEARQQQWRRECLPLLYDWFLCWPQVWVLGGVQWGPRLQVLRATLATGSSAEGTVLKPTEHADLTEALRRKRGSAKSFGIRLLPVMKPDQRTFDRQELYFSERTGPTVTDAPPEPNTLLIAECCIARENLIRAADLSNAWNTDLYASAGTGSSSTDVSLATRAATARRAREHREQTWRTRLEELAARVRSFLATGEWTAASGQEQETSPQNQFVVSMTDPAKELQSLLEAFAEALSSPACQPFIEPVHEELYQRLYNAVKAQGIGALQTDSSILSKWAPETLRASRDHRGRFQNPFLPFHTRVAHGVSIAVPGSSLRRLELAQSSSSSLDANGNAPFLETESLSSQSGTTRDGARLDYDEYLGEMLALSPDEFDDANIQPGSRRDGLSGMGAIYVVNEDGSSGCWARDANAFTGGIVVRRRRRTHASNASSVGAEDQSTRFEDNGPRVFYDEFRVRKRLIHPGEVNRIRYLGMTYDPTANQEDWDLPAEDGDNLDAEPVQTTQCARWVVTHTDAPELMVWNVNEQVHRPDNDKLRPNVPDLVLVGHESEAPYAMDTTFGGDYFPDTFLVASGGTDYQVLVWHLTSDLLLESREQKRATVAEALDDLSGLIHPVRHVAPYALNVPPTSRLIGHTATVEDVCFHPTNPSLLASCGDDGCLLLWDLRAPPRPIGGVRNAHTGDVHCLDWSRDRNARYLITGGDDGVVRLWDMRAISTWAIEGKLHQCTQSAEPVYEFIADDRLGGAVSCVQWNPLDPRYFLSATENEVIVWDTEHMDILFRHAGHRTRIQEAYWNPYIPWVIMTTSEAGESEADGTPSMTSLWRPIDLVHMHDAEVAAEFDVWQNALSQSS
jgi:histone-binding protein RBBP4